LDYRIAIKEGSIQGLVLRPMEAEHGDAPMVIIPPTKEEKVGGLRTDAGLGVKM
jgi:hypothetical protein